MNTPIETPAVMDLTPGDLDALVEALRAYHAIYSPLFQRREPREWAGKYLHGLLLDLPRKSIEPLVLALEGIQPQAVRAMQQFSSEGSGDDTALLHRYWQEVDQEVGEDDGVLSLDGSAFPQQGFDSVGVKRQYCGELCKRVNCQTGVFLGYASPQGYTLLDRRRYLPQE
jgi:SRSO17 transposase